MKNQEKKNWEKPTVAALSIKNETASGTGTALEAGSQAGTKKLNS